jgi:large subunit ribosomal protein L34e
MPRPGQLTKGRKIRAFKTPGGRSSIRYRKFYKADGTCALSGKRMQLPRKAKYGENRKASRSAKRPNRPYGGVLSSQALRRSIIREARKL